ncbi:Rad1/Rec1/Rad17 [Phycomyces blakesleeanus]|uniref:Rad1/Rec1/Rad17 n=1 Tax=Phycomyces blakesleeanus TaxID=4837 RepID=A0ABR3B840_PHYBL
MNLEIGTQADPGSTITSSFSGDVISIKLVVNLLKAIQITKDATCHVVEEGLMFSAGDNSRVVAVAYVKKNMFENYRRSNTVFVPFAIDLAALVNCLSIVSLATGVLSDTCSLFYDGNGGPFEIMREDINAHVVTKCKVNTYDIDGNNATIEMRDDFMESFQVIMKASALVNVFYEIDSTCERVTMSFSPVDNSFRLTGKGTKGSWEMKYHHDSGSFISFKCEEEISFSYHYSYIMACTKALIHATRVHLRFTPNGILCMLLQIEAPKQEGYVEFTVLPSESIAE